MAKNIKACAALHCSNTSRSTSLSFFRFPVNDPSRLEKWMTGIKLKCLKKENHLCCNHFSVEAFTSTLKRRLLPWAYPTIQIPDENLKSTNKKHASFTAVESFPKSEELRAQWIKNIRRENWNPSEHSKLCSKHFPEDMIDRTSVSCVRLRSNAVPVLFDGFPSYLQKKICLENQVSSYVANGIQDSLLETSSVLPKSHAPQIEIKVSNMQFPSQNKRIFSDLSSLEEYLRSKVKTSDFSLKVSAPSTLPKSEILSSSRENILHSAGESSDSLEMSTSVSSKPTISSSCTENILHSAGESSDSLEMATSVSSKPTISSSCTENILHSAGESSDSLEMATSVSSKPTISSSCQEKILHSPRETSDSLKMTTVSTTPEPKTSSSGLGNFLVFNGVTSNSCIITTTTVSDSAKIRALERKVRALQQQLRRQNKKMAQMKMFIKILKEKGYLSD